MGEKKDLLISFCIALWTTVLLFSMFYMPAIAAELTKEDTETAGSLLWKGWFLKSYVEGKYYTGADVFHYVYHKSEVKSVWTFPFFTTVDEAKCSFRAYLNGNKVYNLTGPMLSSEEDWEWDVTQNPNLSYVDMAITWTWARFDNGFSQWERETDEAVIVAG